MPFPKAYKDIPPPKFASYNFPKLDPDITLQCPNRPNSPVTGLIRSFLSISGLNTAFKF